MTCIIVDDEPLAREGLQALIKEVSDLEIVGQFSSAFLASDFLARNEVDLIFLDIQMPKVTGLEFAAQISKQTMIIFTTAYEQYALKSYELNAFDYLLKPIGIERLAKAIDKAQAYKKLLLAKTPKGAAETDEEDYLLIKADRRQYKINFKDIQFIEGLKDYVIVYSGSQKLITAMNLKNIQRKISSPSFCRVSKSYIVNINHVVSFDARTIYIDQFEIPIGEIYRMDFLERYSLRFSQGRKI
ncbi:LytR/AlgR family response regulator transcription factor [Pedobacter chitinilyticus]|uniref:Response regulator transcription factor n=1 Tax=Pedobacter chitinilyticus TaxID=2233776 RepID=A0A3S3SRS6_9SPHI|nr:LytTR family DNA-binding domain-containing protein [Pedobacter chitinilyticus]RWU03999.1 response regulator transcription factor [Pedobacter chitinilyticus]